MFTIQRKGWLWTIAITLTMGAGGAYAGALAQDAAKTDPMAQYVAFAQQQDGAAKTGAAPAAQEKPAVNPGAASGAAVTDQGAAGGAEKIEVTFQEAEKDILTKQANEKLDIMVDSLEFANADLHNVIRIIGERLNLNFIFDAGDIQGKVTLRLRNIRLRDALNSILTTRKLALVSDRSGIFRIVPQEQIGRKTIETSTDVIQLNWIKATDVLKSMKTFLSDDVGKMECNEESNSIIITDVPPHIETIRRLIGQLDIPERQVMIEARLIDINIGALRTLSTDLSVSKLNVQNWQNGAVVAKTVDANGVPKPDTLVALPYSDTLGVVNNLLSGVSVKQGVGTLAFGDTVSVFGAQYNLNAVFTALEERHIVEVLANPRVMTLNNVPANIKIVQRIPYFESGSGASQGSTVLQVEFQEAGVEITTKPIITPNGYVRLEIKMDQKINRGLAVPSSSANPLPPPIIDERMATTNVIVPDKNTVVLGGLRQHNQVEDTFGVPWLHEIPVIGWLFKNKHYEQSKTELVLMMTPRIIQDKVTLTDKEKAYYNKIDANWHLPDYFFDDVHQPGDLHQPKQ